MRGYVKECCTYIPTGHSEILNITEKIQEVNEDIIKLGNMPNGPMHSSVDSSSLLGMRSILLFSLSTWLLHDKWAIHTLAIIFLLQSFEAVAQLLCVKWSSKGSSIRRNWRTWHKFERTISRYLTHTYDTLNSSEDLGWYSQLLVASPSVQAKEWETENWNHFPIRSLDTEIKLYLSVYMKTTCCAAVFIQVSSVQWLSRVRLFATPWIAARQASLSITNSRSSLRLMSIELVMPSSHLILCRPLLLLPPILPASEYFPVSQLFAWGGQSTDYFSRNILPGKWLDCSL